MNVFGGRMGGEGKVGNWDKKYMTYFNVFRNTSVQNTFYRKAFVLWYVSNSIGWLCQTHIDNFPMLGFCINYNVMGRVPKKKNGKIVAFFFFFFWGGGVRKEANLYFGKIFFQWACRIILGPPKHVLHLVWSVPDISTAIRTALKVARTAQIRGDRSPLSNNNTSKKIM